MIGMAKRRRKPMHRWTPAKLRALRERYGWTQAQAAERIGVSLRSWHGWENGATIPAPVAKLLDTLSAD